MVKLKMIIYKSLILLLIISWNQSDAKVINIYWSETKRTKGHIFIFKGWWKTRSLNSSRLLQVKCHCKGWNDSQDVLLSWSKKQRSRGNHLRVVFKQPARMTVWMLLKSIKLIRNPRLNSDHSAEIFNKFHFLKNDEN